MRPKKILHPTDYLPDSRPALDEAIALAREHGAALVLLHVVDTLGPENLTYGEGASARQPEAYRQQLWDELRHVMPGDAHVHVEFVLSEENVVTAILRAREELGCDLIVMGSHGVTGLRRWLLGSVAEQVVRRANCPVLVVKEPRGREELPEVRCTDLHPGRLVRS